MKLGRTLGVVAALGVLACALFVAWYLLFATDESAGREDGATLNAVVDDPARYAGERVTVSGEWAENEYFPADRADQVIVIGDDAGNTLVAIPKLGVAVPDVDENTVLRVTGVVRLPEHGDAGYVDRAGLLSDDGGPAPVVAAERVELAGAEPGSPPPRADRVTVAQLLEDPRAFDEASLIVRGSATQVGGRGFVLSGDRASIFVSAPAAEYERLEGGENVTIRAELGRLSSYSADALEHALASDPVGDQRRSELNLDEIPIEVGEPYLLLRGFAE